MKLMDKEPMLLEIEKGLDLLEGLDDMAHNVARIQLEGLKGRITREPEIAAPYALAYLLDEVGTAIYEKGREDAAAQKKPAAPGTILEWIRHTETREDTAKALSSFLYKEYQDGYKGKARKSSSL